MPVAIPEIPYVRVEENGKLDHQHDAILTHLYLIRSGDKVSQGLRGRIVTLATAAMYYYEKHVFNNEPEIVLAVGYILGKKYPSVAEVAANELKNKFKIPENKIHCLPIETNINPLETSRENEAFQNEIAKNGWKNVAKISEPAHRYRTERSFTAPEGVVVDNVVPDELLRGKVRGLIKRFRHSKYELVHKIYEELANEGLESGLIDNKYLQRNARHRRSRGTHSNKLFNLLDIKIEPNPNA